MKSRFILLFTFSIFLFSSCNYFNGYKIDGNITNANGIKVYLEDITDINAVTIDTATITNNTFELNNYSTNGIYRLRLGEDMSKSIFLYLEKKDNIKISADLNDLENYKVEGSKGSASIRQLNKDVKKYFSALDTAAFKIQNAPTTMKDSLIRDFNKTKDSYIQFLKSFIEKEPNNEVACFALNYLGDFKAEEITYIIDIVGKLHATSPDSKLIGLWYAETQKYQQQIEAQNKGGIALNTQAPNIILENPNGDTIQLNDLKGNIVLLDFWASWCGPCRQENPNVVKVYNQYHAKGFEIFSVSLDQRKDKWVEAIKKDGLIWKNHGSDLQGWSSAPAQTYQVQAIPATFLLDKKGNVIAKDLRGDELEAKLKQIFTEETSK